MADVFSKKKRSEVMSRIRSRGNKATEVALARLLRKNKISGWRRHLHMFGKPGFVFPKAGLVVFVDGCLWHGCPRCYRGPKSNRAFWWRKLAANKNRDRLVSRILRAYHWQVVRIWECDLQKRPQWCIQRIEKCLNPKISSLCTAAAGS
jgi:DNA mismatch endonuclease (patch repair protein)